MKKSAVWLVLWLGALLPAMAQLKVEVTLDQEQFLPGESLPVAVRIANHSGQTLHMGKEKDWLTFSMESRDGFVVTKTGDASVAGEFDLEPSKVAIKHVDLAPSFELTRSGRYVVTANVKIVEWDHVSSSLPKPFTVIQGSKLWEQEFGVPGSGTNGLPEMRRYVVQQANYVRSQLRLYVRLTDGLGIRSYSVIPIGPLVSFSRVEHEVDRASNLHVMFADGPHSYLYTVVSPDGQVVVRRQYEYQESRPRLQTDDKGIISVRGGLLREDANQSASTIPAAAPLPDDLPKSKAK
jgi:hypothetical protein